MSVSTKNMRILKTVELADFAENDAKRIRILKTVEFECCCSAEQIEAIANQCTFVKFELSNLPFSEEPKRMNT